MQFLYYIIGHNLSSSLFKWIRRSPIHSIHSFRTWAHGRCSLSPSSPHSKSCLFPVNPSSLFNTCHYPIPFPLTHFTPLHSLPSSLTNLLHFLIWPHYSFFCNLNLQIADFWTSDMSLSRTASRTSESSTSFIGNNSERVSLSASRRRSSDRAKPTQRHNFYAVNEAGNDNSVGWRDSFALKFEYDQFNNLSAHSMMFVNKEGWARQWFI